MDIKMKHAFKFSSLFLACSLALSGCGGGSSSNNNPSVNNNSCTSPDSSATDLQKAKNFINSSNAILANAQTTFNTHQPADLSGAEELSAATSAVSSLIGYASTKANGGSLTLSTSEIQTELAINGDQNIFSNINGLTVSVNNGTVTVNGTFTLKIQTGYSYTTIYTPIYGDAISVNVNNFAAKIPSENTTGTNYNAQLNANSAISVTLANGKTTTLKANSNSTATLAYQTSNTLQNQIDSSVIPNSASINIAGISVISGTTKLSLDQFTLTGQKVQYTEGSSVVKTSLVPTKLLLKGSATQDSNTAAIDATINLTNDLSQVVKLDSAGNETSTGFVKGNFTLNVSTTIKVGTQTNVFNAKFAGDRTAFNAAQLSNIELSVNCDKLTGTATYTGATTSQPEALKVIIKHPNGASTDIKNILDFTTSDIIVNGHVEGTISKTSNSLYQAKFNDGFIIVIAP